MFILVFILKCLWFILPAGFANMVPVLVRRFKILAIPVDFNKHFKGKPIFGQAKTWRGAITGLVLALILFTIQKWLYQFSFFERISLIDYNQYSLLLGFLLGFGAIFGDLLESFLKRRLNIPPGKPWIPFDQIDWVLGALVFSFFVYIPSWPIILTIIFSGFILHLLVNYIGFLLKIKEIKF